MRSGTPSFRRRGLRSNSFLLFLIVASLLIAQPFAQFITTTRPAPATLPGQKPDSSTQRKTSQRVAAMPGSVHRRAEAVGSACSSEGQWNCMTRSWQRCAAGRWSEVVNCAKGTVCAPAGLTNDFRVQHDGSVDGSGRAGGSGGSGGLSTGPRGSTSVPLLGVVVLLWAFYA